MSDEIAVSARNVSKRYLLYNQPQDRLKHSLFWRLGKNYAREFWALRDVSFEVHKGERLGVIGRNGAGKSTLLQILAGTLSPTTGEVNVNGRVAAILELGSGFNFEFTGRENIFLNGAILGIGREEMEQRFNDITAFADIGEFIDQPMKLYSSGMVIRLAFAISASICPDILILDEALAVGDIFFTQKCFRRLEELIARGTAIVLVTHDVTAVGQFCSTVMVLDRGKTIFHGTPIDGIRKYLALQRHDNLPVIKPSRNLEIERADSDHVLNSESLHDFRWPPPDAFLDMKDTLPEGISWARCTSIAICNEQETPCTLFQIGEKAVLFYEFEILEDIGVPIGGVTIVNDKNIIVHGKNSLQHGLKNISPVSKGTIVRFRQSVVLDIAAGNYTFLVGLATLSPTDYEHANYMSWGALSEKTIRVLSVGRAGVFTVTLRSEGQALPHHGLCNLAGDCAITILRDKDSDETDA
jgi:ABC-type polysaccharide/polyol phosphate transport system ATPase subunit